MTAGPVQNSERVRHDGQGRWRGALVCLAMFALGGAVLWGLFLSPRARSPGAPAVAWGAPVVPVRFVSLDFGGRRGANDALVTRVRELDPDFVLVQNVRFDDALPLAEAVGMSRTYHPTSFQRPNPRSRDSPGDLLLSKHALYETRALVLGADPADVHARGVRAVAVVGGVRFVVASGVGATDDSLRAFDASRKEAGSPPGVLATGFVRPESGRGSYAGELLPTVTLSQEAGQGGPIVPVASVYADRSWVMTAGNTVAGDAGVPMILYAELKAWTPGAAAATKPWR